MPADTQSEDPIELLRSDHKQVLKLFETFKDEGDENKKMAIAEHICLALTVHTQIEEELFYPALRGKLDEVDIDEAYVEHAAAKDLIAQIEEAGEVSAMFEARLQVLGEQVSHHIKEEEEKIFPAAKKAKIDTPELGQKMAQRKAALMRDHQSDVADAPVPTEAKRFDSGGADMQPDTGSETSSATSGGKKSAGEPRSGAR